MSRMTLTLAVLVFTVPSVVYAHAGLVKSIPGSRALLTRSPDHIELCFNEAVELKFSSVKLQDAAKTPVQLGELKLRDDPKCVHASAPPLAPGVYQVHYRVLSQDGHVVEYGYQFTIGPNSASK